MTKYNITVEETVKVIREYEVETNEDIDGILDEMETATRYGFETPGSFFNGSPDLEVISSTDETDFSSPESIEYEVIDVMEDQQ
ncbi:hypothetical protein [Staphylococcus haemolyticus]|uniref:hypothetical protein n=1 Tax=Staphylococcus haemolyticus TaxID=1283 RepID=UPI002904ED86|nr:hypothetical protein [Staphylococcus haemolyticus]MDU0441553.1 hypothetical protein [Staphylococcus haemolyticus]MDU0473671.1 hypothetical protein [Staphylococcus haemolyticus]